VGRPLPKTPFSTSGDVSGYKFRDVFHNGQRIVSTNELQKTLESFTADCVSLDLLVAGNKAPRPQSKDADALRGRGEGPLESVLIVDENTEAARIRISAERKPIDTMTLLLILQDGYSWGDLLGEYRRDMEDRGGWSVYGWQAIESEC
jgi:hypothetical protein